MADPPGSTPAYPAQPSRSSGKPKPSKETREGPIKQSQSQPQQQKQKQVHHQQAHHQKSQQKHIQKQQQQKQQHHDAQNPPPPTSIRPETPGKTNRKETEERIGKLLTRLHRQFASQRPSEKSSSFQVPPRPPDQAATSLGRELADAFLQTLELPSQDNMELESARHKVLHSLENRGIHPSIPHAFFGELVATSNHPRYRMCGWEDWLPAFILQCEQRILDDLPNSSASASAYDDEDANGLNETLAAAVRAYGASHAMIVLANAKQANPNNNNNNRRKTDEMLTSIYRRMQTSAGRTILLREFSRATKELELIPQQMSPLMAACVLTLWATPHSEKTQLLQELWRQCWDVIYATDTFSQFWDILFWMTEALNIFLLVLPSAGRISREDRPAWRELAQCWLVELGDMIAFVVHATTSDEDNNGPMSAERLLAEWLQLVMNKLLPILATQGAGSYRLSLEPLLEQLNGLIVEMDDSLVQLRTMVVFKLSTMALSTPLKGESRSILSLFSYLLPSESAFARGLTSTVGAIYMQDDSCRAAAKHLLKTAQGVDQQLMGHPDRSKTSSVIQLLEDGEDGFELLNFFASVNAEDLDKLSAVKQIETLLLGISMMEITGNDELPKLAADFLKGLLRRYQHLGLSLMPSLISDINAAAIEKSPSELLSKLQFLVDSVTVDPSCAQQAWNLLGIQMLEPHNPVTLRVTILRLLPRLCVTNKRLYRRVMDTLGAHRDGKPKADPNALQPASMSIQSAVLEVRLAVAASIADLAKDDMIRDPTDCIGWIQEFLVEDFRETPAKALLVHYAVLSLHYLLVAQELDFNLVLKVLKKKLCTVTSIEDVKQLPAVVQEALALLLGDGECKDGSSDEDEKEDSKPNTPEISPQVAGAVQLLIDLGVHYESVEPDNGISADLVARIRRNIYKSLSNYSLEALGLDEDGIKAAVAWEEQGEREGDKPPLSASRYVALRQLAANGIQLPKSLREKVEDFDTVLAQMNSKVLLFEEEALSSSLWATKGTRHHVVQQRRADTNKSSSKETSSLPPPSRLQVLHKQNPSTSSCIARLLCFEGSSLKKFLSLAGEITFQEREPFSIVFLVQAWLNASSRLLGTLYEGGKFRGFGQTLEELRRWGLNSGSNGDAMFFTMVSLALYLPHRDETAESPAVDQVLGEIFQAFKNLQFRNDDMGKITFAMTAIVSLRWGFQDRLFEVIALLEQSVKGYGGQITFGAAYGLALIAQAISQTDRMPSSGDSRAVKTKIGHIVGFLVGEVVACTQDTNDRSDILTTLVACLQSGVSTPGLVGSLAESVSKQFSIIPANMETAKYLFISLSICLPSLSQVNGDLLLGTVFLLERFQWGSGKGIALIPVLHEAKSSGVLTEDEFQGILNEYGRIFEQVLAGKDASDFSLDLFYAVMGTSTKASPHVVRQYLMQTTRRFDDNRCTSPLIGAFTAVASFPGLGYNTKVFTAPAQLRQDTPKAVIDGVLEVLTGALNHHTDYSRPEYSKNAVMILGLLASMKNQPSDLANLTPNQERAALHGGPSKLKSLTLDFSLLPSPRIGTLLHDMIGLIQRAHQTEQAEQLDQMMRYMGCLEHLSLPGHFSKHFLEPLISENNESTKEGCIALLKSQVCGRRRAVFDGREFTNMALQISIMPLVSFNALLGRGKASSRFVQCLEGIVASLPSELVEGGTKNLWEICLSLSDDTDLVVEFLNCIQSILKSHKGKKGKGGKQSNLSPKTKIFMEHFITTRVFSDLRELSWATSLGEKAAAEEGKLMKSYVACLTQLSPSSLEEHGIFSFKGDDSFTGEVLRALVILELVRSGYFGDTARAMRELSRVLAWFTRKFIKVGPEVYVETMRRIACAISAGTKVLTTSHRREILLSILEQLLLCQPSACAVGLDLLSALVASWCSDVATDGDLSMMYVCIHATDKLQGLSDTALNQVFAFFRHDLPFNLAIYGRREKIGAIIANQVWRLYSTWSKHGMDEEILKSLKKAFICGSSSETKEEDFVSLSSSILLAADDIQSSQTLLR